MGVVWRWTLRRPGEEIGRAEVVEYLGRRGNEGEGVVRVYSLDRYVMYTWNLDCDGVEVLIIRFDR